MPPPSPPDVVIDDSDLGGSQPNRSSYEERHRYAGARRRNQLKDVLHWVIIVLMLVGVLILSALFVTWAWHLMAPLDCQWLEPEQLKTIERVLFSGIIGLVLGKTVDKQLDKLSD